MGPDSGSGASCLATVEERAGDARERERASLSRSQPVVLRRHTDRSVEGSAEHLPVLLREEARQVVSAERPGQVEVLAVLCVPVTALVGLGIGDLRKAPRSLTQVPQVEAGSHPEHRLLPRDRCALSHVHRPRSAAQDEACAGSDPRDGDGLVGALASRELVGLSLRVCISLGVGPRQGLAPFVGRGHCATEDLDLGRSEVARPRRAQGRRKVVAQARGRERLTSRNRERTHLPPCEPGREAAHGVCPPQPVGLDPPEPRETLRAEPVERRHRAPRGLRCQCGWPVVRKVRGDELRELLEQRDLAEEIRRQRVPRPFRARTVQTRITGGRRRARTGTPHHPRRAPHATHSRQAAPHTHGTPRHARDASKLLPPSPSRYTCAVAKKSTPSGTPALVALDRARVAHTVHAYEHDPSTDLGYGLEAAAAIGVPSAQVFKTLLALADGRLTVGVVPVDGRLDLKALARAVGAKKAEMADPAAAERATGYVVGGISPLGQKQRLRTVVDESALDHAIVYVSAGRRGLDVGLAPADLVALTDATTAALSRD